MSLKVEELTISQLLEFYVQRSAETYRLYKDVVCGEDEYLKDQTYKNWTKADDCRLSIDRLLQMARADLI